MPSQNNDEVFNYLSASGRETPPSGVSHEVLAINKLKNAPCEISARWTRISAENEDSSERGDEISMEIANVIKNEQKDEEVGSPRDTSKTNSDERSANNSEAAPNSTLNSGERESNSATRCECGESTRRGKRRSRTKKIPFSLVDILISAVLIGPLAIGVWRGVWTTMDIYKDVFPASACFLLGTLMHIIFVITRYLLYACTTDVRGKWWKRVSLKCMQIFYTYVFVIACISQWRGGWILIDEYVYVNFWAIVLPISLMLMCLMHIRCIRNLNATPYIVILDTVNYTFIFPTKYRSNTRDWSLYLLDCAFSVGVVGTLVVFVWRGVWILFDIYLYPGDRESSALGSLAIGYGIVAVTFCLQPLMRYACSRLQGLPRLLTADGFLLLSFLGTVNVWRGIWMVLDLWLVPENPEVSCWITHIGCFVFLVLLNCSNSVLVRGVYIDAEEDDGKCVVFPCHYLRLFFKIEREKKEARRRNLLVASKDFKPRPEGNGKDAENGALLPNSTAATIIPANPESHV